MLYKIEVRPLATLEIIEVFDTTVVVYSVFMSKQNPKKKRIL